MFWFLFRLSISEEFLINDKSTFWAKQISIDDTITISSEKTVFIFFDKITTVLLQYNANVKLFLYGDSNGFVFTQFKAGTSVQLFQFSNFVNISKDTKLNCEIWLLPPDICKSAYAFTGYHSFTYTASNSILEQESFIQKLIKKFDQNMGFNNVLHNFDVETCIFAPGKGRATFLVDNRIKVSSTRVELQFDSGTSKQFITVHNSTGEVLVNSRLDPNLAIFTEPIYVTIPNNTDFETFSLTISDGDQLGDKFRNCAITPIAYYSSLTSVEPQITIPSSTIFDSKSMKCYKSISDIAEEIAQKIGYIIGGIVLVCYVIFAVRHNCSKRNENQKRTPISLQYKYV